MLNNEQIKHVNDLAGDRNVEALIVATFDSQGNVKYSLINGSLNMWMIMSFTVQKAVMDQMKNGWTPPVVPPLVDKGN